MHLNAFRIPYAPAGWLETNSETNWARKHATMGAVLLASTGRPRGRSQVLADRSYSQDIYVYA
jgi:hypothetical protein